MDVHQELVGHTGEDATGASSPVESYTLSTGDGPAVTVWTYGATLVEVLVPDRAGLLGNVVRRLPDLESYLDRARNPYVGSTVGRYCRGVREARFDLDGVRYDLDRNDGRHHVHGGSTGYDRRVFTARVEGTSDEVGVVLRLVSADGDQGYPGEVTVEVAYRLHRSGRLTFDYRATTTAPTIIGLTNHAYWNLAGGGVVDGHRLAVNAGRSVAFDADLLPVAGPPVDIGGGDLDYRVPRTIGDAALDNFFVLDDPAWAAELADPSSGRRMRVVTDQPGLGVYSADGFSARRGGLCLEAGAWPDAPNRPDFPSVRLDPGETYRQRTVHDFDVD
ncbi:aldose epimerase family protein [Micromonospora sp. RTGN7]|uniref:aldose epimerase family protein n=1 Tax=Micromonospora sp. RTGN7 TaxID=3016526 RepID=UPI0029FF10B6|nr:aldose epimerase family protein [Micromonospora sp. RTGN7]